MAVEHFRIDPRIKHREAKPGKLLMKGNEGIDRIYIDYSCYIELLHDITDPIRLDVIC